MTRRRRAAVPAFPEVRRTCVARIRQGQYYGDVTSAPADYAKVLAATRARAANQGQYYGDVTGTSSARPLSDDGKRALSHEARGAMRNV